MESKRRFKAEISNKYVQRMFTRKPTMSKGQSSKTVESKPDKKTITSIPSEMLPKRKTIPRAEKEYDHPQFWIKPEKPLTLSRAEVLRIERDNIREKLTSQHGWSRAAKQLKTAIEPPKKAQTRNLPEDDDDDDFSSGDQRDKSDAIIKRKNISKEFLNLIFDTARSESIKRKKTMPVKVVRKVPKLATGIEPDADELIL